MGDQPVIVDTDPGIDDALAFVYMAALYGGWDLKAITAVAGNVPLDRTFANARGLAALLDIEDDVPVYGGCPKPLVRTLRTAEYVHGEDGLGGARLPAPSVPERGEHAVHALNELARRYEDELTIIALGPLTNIAAALILDPALARRVKHLVFMGGAVNVPGNVPPGVAEFNVCVDPEAARLVVESGLPFTMVGLDASGRALLSREQARALEDSTTPLNFARELLDDYLNRAGGREACALHDPLAVAVAGDEGWIEAATGNLYVETGGEFTPGKTSFVRKELEAGREIDGLDSTVAFGRVALSLAREDFPDHFIETLNGRTANLRKGD